MIDRSRKRVADHLDQNEGLVEVCVFARQQGKGKAVDVWTGRVGLLDLEHLSDQFGRVIVWDDIRGDKTIERSVNEILLAIAKYYGFTPRVGTDASVHVGGIDALAGSLDILLSISDDRSLKTAHDQIAVVDLGSCGTTRLQWLDIIPLLRRYYSYVVGINFSTPELCGLDPEFKLPDGLTRDDQRVLLACDYWLLASDKSISGQVGLSVEARTNAFTKAVNELCGELASAEFVKDVFSGEAVRRFVKFGP
jgi:hypothetical protein